ncbi:MAG: phosphate starvation-inducible protein PhoH, partial [Zetaproteobacteria bacterium CG02_land_8_20_14_3_00_50_9]
MQQQPSKIFVLDTNVLIHDPNALSHFDEHDVVLPLVVLEEMDKVKRGLDELARNVREVSRYLDQLSEQTEDLSKGCLLPGGGRLFFELNQDPTLLPPFLANDSGDNRIISVTLALLEKNTDRQVVLVSKDINLRIKARALGLTTEDYRSDRVVIDPDALTTGQIFIDDKRWEQMAVSMEVSAIDHGNQYLIDWPQDMELPPINSFVILPGDRQVALRCTHLGEGRKVELQDIYSYRSERHAV